jgi:hypothetical protein
MTNLSAKALHDISTCRSSSPLASLVKFRRQTALRRLHAKFPSPPAAPAAPVWEAEEEATAKPKARVRGGVRPLHGKMAITTVFSPLFPHPTP